MTDLQKKPRRPSEVRAEWEQWTRTASAEDLADAVPVDRERDADDPNAYTLTVTRRTQAYLWLRLTEKLERAVTSLADATNAGTYIMARLTALYVALTGVVAVAAIVGAAASIYSALKAYGAFIAWASLGLATGVLLVTAIVVTKLWPRR